MDPGQTEIRFSRYVAIGDSTTEGLEDPTADGLGYRGFADRLAARLAREQPALLYANLGIRGRKMRQIREEQLEPALALEPDEDPWAPLPPADPIARGAAISTELLWMSRHMAPWIMRRIRGVSSGDGLSPKRPALTRLELDLDSETAAELA